MRFTWQLLHSQDDIESFTSNRSQHGFIHNPPRQDPRKTQFTTNFFFLISQFTTNFLLLTLNEAALRAVYLALIIIVYSLLRLWVQLLFQQSCLKKSSQNRISPSMNFRQFCKTPPYSVFVFLLVVQITYLQHCFYDWWILKI